MNKYLKFAVGFLIGALGFLTGNILFFSYQESPSQKVTTDIISYCLIVLLGGWQLAKTKDKATIFGVGLSIISLVSYSLIKSLF